MHVHADGHRRAHLRKTPCHEPTPTPRAPRRASRRPNKGRRQEPGLALPTPLPRISTAGVVGPPRNHRVQAQRVNTQRRPAPGVRRRCVQGRPRGTDAAMPSRCPPALKPLMVGAVLVVASSCEAPRSSSPPSAPQPEAVGVGVLAAPAPPDVRHGPCASDADCEMIARGDCGPCGEPCALEAVTRTSAQQLNQAMAGRNCPEDPNVECEPCPELESVDSFWMGLVLKSCLDESLA